MILQQNHAVMSESVSSVAFVVSIRASLRDSVAMAATVVLPSCAAAATAEDEVSTASGSPSSAPSAAGTPVAKAKSAAAGGRARGGKKPQIDIDVEILEANRLAELFKKMQKASKVASRNASRQRQRLVRKAQKLSEQDLMRLAVIKRCGMFVPDAPDAAAASASGADGGPPQAKKSKAQEQLSSRFKTLVSGVAGASELCEALAIGTENRSAATAPTTIPVVSSPVAKQPARLRALVLQRLPSQPFTPRAAVPPAVAADEDDGEDDEEDHETETAESAEGGGE